jgi:hypothetical protein
VCGHEATELSLLLFERCGYAHTLELTLSSLSPCTSTCRHSLTLCVYAQRLVSSAQRPALSGLACRPQALRACVSLASPVPCAARSACLSRGCLVGCASCHPLLPRPRTQDFISQGLDFVFASGSEGLVSGESPRCAQLLLRKIIHPYSFGPRANFSHFRTPRHRNFSLPAAEMNATEKYAPREKCPCVSVGRGFGICIIALP